jgi:hypothetical protein
MSTAIDISPLMALRCFAKLSSHRLSQMSISQVMILGTSSQNSNWVDDDNDNRSKIDAASVV